MIQFSAGYQLTPGQEYIDTLIGYKDRLAEVYFSWGDMPSGRTAVTENNSLPAWEALAKQKEDLSRLQAAGIPLVLLLNANCYGGAALSRTLFSSIGETIDNLSSFLNIIGITTASPVIARFIRGNFSSLDVRSSVNMDIGTTEAMRYLGDIFTGYYLKRELNRDIKKIRELRAFCDVHGKTLHVLGNGGCLAHCPARQFHDNLVAHEKELAGMDNVMNFTGLCREYFSCEGTYISYIRDLNFIRPEDVQLYEPYFHTMKLATRVSRNPSLIVNAYMAGYFNGNLLELLEPDYSASLYPRVIDNQRFPAEFGKITLSCGRLCVGCGYCSHITENVLCHLKEDNVAYQSNYKRCRI
jgi:ferredoxin